MLVSTAAGLLAGSLLLLATAVVCTVSFGVLKYFSAKRGPGGCRTRYATLGVLNSFSGGVFLGTSILHLVPEAREQMGELYKELGIPGNYPLSEFLAGVGFFLVMIVEHVAETFHERASGREPETAEPRKEQHHHHHMKEYGTIEKYQKTVNSNGGVEARSPDGAGLRSLVLLLALCFHSVFDGLVLGLQRSATKVWTIFLAVVLHKCLIAFSLTLQLTGSHPRATGRVFVYLSAFCLVSPLGAAVGSLFADSRAVSGLARVAIETVLQGLSAGTFFYVTVFEILGPEINVERNLLKVLGAIVGFGIVSGMKFLDE